jgi:hypothetical protein
MMSVSFEWGVMSLRGLYEGSITFIEELLRMWISKPHDEAA